MDMDWNVARVAQVDQAQLILVVLGGFFRWTWTGMWVHLKLTRRVATYHQSSACVRLLLWVPWVRARTDFHSGERDANNVNICQLVFCSSSWTKDKAF